MVVRYCWLVGQQFSRIWVGEHLSSRDRGKRVNGIVPYFGRLVGG